MTVRLNGVCTNNITGDFIETLLKLSEESGELPKDNEILKKKQKLSQQPNEPVPYVQIIGAA
jgi:hypothetical protein